MKTTLYIVLILAVALASVIASELLLTRVWLTYAPTAVTSHLFWLGLLPVQFVVVGISMTTLLKILRTNYNIYVPVYALSFALFHSLELNALDNPPLDIGLYAAAILIASAVWGILLKRRNISV